MEKLLNIRKKKINKPKHGKVILFIHQIVTLFVINHKIIAVMSWSCK